MNFKQFLNEMPITNFNKIGDWSPDAKKQYGFNKQDAGILNSEKGVTKIIKKWSNTQQDFNLYFVRQKNAWKHREVGEVTPEWVKENLNLDITPNEDAITIIFTNNLGGEKMINTAWIIAHRLSHAIRRDDSFDKYFSKVIEKDFKQLLKEIYKYNSGGTYDYQNYGSDQLYLKALAMAVGTMKSAQQRKIVNFGEFTHELVAQYVITGKIQFGQIPRFLITKNTQAWGHPNPQGKYSQLDKEKFEYWNEVLQSYAYKYEGELSSIFDGLVGRMFVM